MHLAAKPIMVQASGYLPLLNSQTERSTAARDASRSWLSDPSASKIELCVAKKMSSSLTAVDDRARHVTRICCLRSGEEKVWITHHGEHKAIMRSFFHLERIQSRVKGGDVHLEAPYTLIGEI